MGIRDTHVRAEEIGTWTLDFFDVQVTPGYARSAVEVSRGGTRHARLIAFKDQCEAQSLAAELRERARAWINEFEKRRGWPTTDFGDSVPLIRTH